MDRVGGHPRHLPNPPYRFPVHLFVILAMLLGGLLLVSMASAEEFPCGELYVTAQGDNLNQIAVDCNTSVPAILAANPEISPTDPLLPGQVLRIPQDGAVPVTGSAAPLVFPSDPIIPETGPFEQTYSVQPGDTLSVIAARYGITVPVLLQNNPQITNPNLIYPGQVIIIPASIPPPDTDPGIIPDTGPGELLYTVQRGDTLSEIALRHGIPTASLIQRNTQIANPDLIYPGQIIVIPGALPLPTPTPDPPQPPTPTIVFPTPVPTPTLSPLAPPIDIIPETGATLHQEDFSVPGDWFTAIDDNFSMEYAEDGYRILNRSPNSFVSSVLAMDITDLHVETRANRVGGPQTGYYGVVCRWQNVSNFYAFVIGSDGFYGIARVLNGQLTFLGEGRTTSGPILLDTANNLVGGSCIGDTLSLYVNHQSLLQVQDQTFASGNPGLVTATRATPGTHVHFDDFLIRR